MILASYRASKRHGDDEEADECLGDGGVLGEGVGWWWLRMAIRVGDKH